MLDIYTLLLLLFTKHMLCDYFLQNSYQLANKGTYGHPGGILHAGYHAIGSFLALLVVVAPIWALLWALVDGIVHYHIDWAKVKITTLSGATPADNLWWILFGFDQHLHYLTYLVIAYSVLH